MTGNSVKVKPGVIFWNANGNFVFADLSTNRHGDLEREEFLFLSSCQELESGNKKVENSKNVIGNLEKKGLLTHEDVKKRFLQLSQRQEEKTVLCELTKACNLACRMCYNNSGKPLPNEMNLEMWKKTIAKVSELGKCHLTLTGGEPLIRKDLLEIISQMKEYGHYVEIITNGTLIDYRLASHLHSLETDFVFVSVDAAHPQTFERIRGRSGSFSRVIRATQALKKEDMPFGWLVTLMKPNLNELPHIFELAHKLEVPHIWLSRLVLTGRASKALAISPSEEYHAREVAEDLEKSYSGDLTVKFGSFLSCDSNPENSKNFLRNSCCNLGISRFYITSDGHVALCQLLSSKRFHCGHILTDDVKEILECSSWFKLLRETPLSEFNSCSSCGLRYLCLGGCRGEAYLTTGSIKGCDLPYKEYLLHVLDRATSLS